MNSSKRTVTAVIVILAIIIVGAIVWLGKPSGNAEPNFEANGESPIAVSETTKVSGSLSEYQNAELGFSVKYPNFWEANETNSGINFVIPIDKSQVSTIATLQANVLVRASGTCAFPPVPYIKDKGTMKVGTLDLNMISMTNTIQNRTYFNRLYSLQSNGICYMFNLASIEYSPASKGFTGSQATQAQNNNKALINNADSDFTNMVKSFAFVTLPQGKDETQASPKK